MEGIETTLYCTRCKQRDVDLSDIAKDGDVAENLVHVDCGGVIEEVCATCLGLGEVVTDEQVYSDEPHYAPIGTKKCPTCQTIEDENDDEEDDD